MKFELSIPEAKRTLEAFTEDRRAALDAVSSGLRAAVADGLNQLLNLEMAMFLGKGGQNGNKRNGCTVRECSLKGLGTLQLKGSLTCERREVRSSQQGLDARFLQESRTAL